MSTYLSMKKAHTVHVTCQQKHLVLLQPDQSNASSTSSFRNMLNLDYYSSVNESVQVFHYFITWLLPGNFKTVFFLFLFFWFFFSWLPGNQLFLKSSLPSYRYNLARNHISGITRFVTPRLSAQNTSVTYIFLYLQITQGSSLIWHSFTYWLLQWKLSKTKSNENLRTQKLLKSKNCICIHIQLLKIHQL